MINKILAFLSNNKRTIRKDIRTKYTRPCKEWTHLKLVFFRRFLSNFKNTFLIRKNIRFFGIMIFFFFLFRDFAFAAETTKDATGAKAINDVIEVLNGIVLVIQMIAQPLLMLAGWLLSPDWTFGDIIGLRPILHQMWVYVSNVVYVIFAFLLVGIAIMNIFKDGGSNYSIKIALPRLVIGILVVPFTWFIVSGTMSISNVLTASVIQLPFDIISKTGHNEILDQKIIPQTVILDLSESNTGEVVAEGANDDGSVTKISLKDFLDSQKGAYNLLPYYAYGVFHIDKIKTISNNQSESTVKKVVDVFKKLVTGTIFSLVFCLLVIAITYVLFSRMAMLWLYAIFSPLFALGIFFGGKAPEKLKGFKNFMDVKEFISLAMVPVFVSAALAFGFMFISLAVNTKQPDNSYSNIASCEGKTDCQIISQGKFDLQIRGNFGDSSKAVGGARDTATGLISYVIINMIAIAILWMAVIAALGASSITKSMVEPFEKIGKNFGEFAKSMPKYTPIPLGRGKDGKMRTMSLDGLERLSAVPQDAMRSKSAQSATPFENMIRDKIGGNPFPGEKKDEIARKIRNANDETAIKSAVAELKSASNQYGRSNSGILELEKLAADKMVSNTKYMTELEKLGIDKEKLKKGDEQHMAAAILGVHTSQTAEINKYLANKAGTGKEESVVQGSAGKEADGTSKKPEIKVEKTILGKYTLDLGMGGFVSELRGNKLNLDKQDLEKIMESKGQFTEAEINNKLTEKISKEAAKDFIEQIKAKEPNFFKAGSAPATPPPATQSGGSQKGTNP